MGQAVSEVPQLPPGFVLGADTSSVPAMPPGFQLGPKPPQLPPLDINDPASVAAYKGQPVDVIRKALGYNQSPPEAVLGGAESALQGASMNFADEALGALTSPEFAKKAFAPQRQFAKDNPITDLGLQATGMLASGTALEKMAAMAAPELTSGVASFAKAHPYISTSALGALAGGVGSAGSASEGDRTASGVLGTIVGGVAAPALSAVGSSLAPYAKGLLAKVSGPVEGIPSTSTAQEAIGAISNQPVSSIQTPENLSKIAGEKGQVLNLPQGVKNFDTDALRLQERARQGGLGQDAEKSIRNIDAGVTQSAKDATQALVGKVTTDNPDDLLAQGIGKFKARALAEKQYAGKLMDERNQKIANAGIYRQYTQQTLLPKVQQVLETPENSVFMETSGATPIKEFSQILNNLTTVRNEKGQMLKPLDFAKLQGWSSTVSRYARQNQGKSEGVVANQMVGAYNDWLDSVTKSAFKEGDDSVAQSILSANKNYASFKNKYGTDVRSGQARAFQDAVQKDELTPRQLVNMVFGSSSSGKDISGQVVKRMIDAMPQGARREGLRNDFRSGLIMRAYNDSLHANRDLKLGVFANKLNDLLQNDVYSRNLSTPEHTNSIRAIISDLRSYVKAVNDPTIRSNSGTGGYLERMGERILRNPAIRHATLGQSENLNLLLQNGLKAKSRAQVKKVEKSFFQQLGSAIDSNPKVYGVDPVASGIVAGVAAGQNKNDNAATK